MNLIKVVNIVIRSFIFSLSFIFAFSLNAYAKKYDSAEFMLLNKVTTEKETVKITQSRDYLSHGIKIKLISCQKQDEKKSSKALIRISRVDGSSQEIIFSGWTFAHSPSISMLEHPVYNVILLNCGVN